MKCMQCDTGMFWWLWCGMLNVSFQFNLCFFLLVLWCLGKLSGSVLCQVFYSYGDQNCLSVHTRSSLALKAFTKVAVTTSSGSVFLPNLCWAPVFRELQTVASCVSNRVFKEGINCNAFKSMDDFEHLNHCDIRGREGWAPEVSLCKDGCGCHKSLW